MRELANPKFMKNMSPSKFSRTATDQSDWQDESRNSGRRIKLPFMKSEVSLPTFWVNLFNSRLSPVATLIKLSVPSVFLTKILYASFILYCKLAQHVTPF